MYKCFCDICGREFDVTEEVKRYKVKREWSSWHESGWENLEVHEACWRDLAGFIAKRREEDAEND